MLALPADGVMSSVGLVEAQPMSAEKTARTDNSDEKRRIEIWVAAARPRDQ
jgi:hypothetical protein